MIIVSIWDILPILGIIALIAAFAVKRRRMKREEQDLRETLSSLQEGLLEQEQEGKNGTD